jgi:hypothetical protein
MKKCIPSICSRCIGSDGLGSKGSIVSYIYPIRRVDALIRRVFLSPHSMTRINLYRAASIINRHFNLDYMEGEVIIVMGALPHRRQVFSTDL